MKYLKRLTRLLVAAAPTAVGGQAVIEGVLMRSPRAFAVAVRKPNGKLAIRTEEWIPLGERFKLFKLPFLRGVALLIETLKEGYKALHYSAQQAGQEEGEEPLSNTALTLTMLLSLGLAFAIFKGVPHLTASYLNPALGLPAGTDSFWFHLTDGVIKLIVFVGYIALISRMKDIRRVFQYHGAEHKSIHVFENNKPLDAPNTRDFPRLHPRCGTTFLVFAIIISLVAFAVIFPLIPLGFLEGQPRIVEILVTLAIKLPLLFPIAGISYEILRLTSKLGKNPKTARFLAPGMALQYITTREPDDDQITVALASLRAALDFEKIEYIKGDFPEEELEEDSEADAA